MKRTLIVVDMQNDFITGALGTPEAQAIVPKVREKFLEFYDNNEYVFFTRDTHFENYLDTAEGQKLPVTHCIENTDGWEISSDVLAAHEEDKITDIIDKKTFGFDSWGVYDDIFEECDEIVVVGVCTDICVVSNVLALKALYPEIEITVDASCCAGVTPESHQAALTTMKMCQINGIGE